MLTREEYLKLPLTERFIKLSKVEEERANELHDKLIKIDLHTHIMEEFDRQRVRNSGVNCFFEAVACITEDFDESMKKLGCLFNFIRRQPQMNIAFCFDDVRRAKKERRQVVMAQLEPQTIGLHLNRIEIAYGLGVRMMLLTFNFGNYVGGGCGDRIDHGLSYYGLEFIDRMNKVGMMIDVSHSGERTTMEAAEASKAPILCNHTGARALNPRCKRLKTDEAIKAIAETGGLIGISAVPNQLSNAKRQGIQDLLDHVEYVIKLVGVDHVAIGLDNIFGDHVAAHRRMVKEGVLEPLARIGMELNADFMEGIESPEEWPNITRGLVSEGYSDQEIKKIIGGNASKIIGRIIGR